QATETTRSAAERVSIYSTAAAASIRRPMPLPGPGCRSTSEPAGHRPQAGGGAQRRVGARGALVSGLELGWLGSAAGGVPEAPGARGFAGAGAVRCERMDA